MGEESVLIEGFELTEAGVTVEIGGVAVGADTIIDALRAGRLEPALLSPREATVVLQLVEIARRRADAVVSGLSAASPRLQSWVEGDSGRSPDCVAPFGDDGWRVYRSTNKTVYSAKYHIIWCSKYRRRVLVNSVDVRLKEIIGDVVDELGGTVIEVEVMPDHVHLLVEVPPTVALSKLVGRLKGRSSRLLRAEFVWLRRLPTLWTRSLFVSTVGGAPLEVVRQYVENQKTAA